MSADFSWSSVHRELDAGLTLVQGSSLTHRPLFLNRKW